MRFTTYWVLLLLPLIITYFIWLNRSRQGGRRQWREKISIALRLVIGMLIILALAGTQIVRSADELAVVFLVDASDSISADQAEQAETFVREAIQTMQPNERAAVVLFGTNALVERPMSGLTRLDQVTSVPQTLHTDLSEAIRLGLALFPAGSARRLVILSDGGQTIGNAVEAARVAAAANVPIDIYPLPHTTNVTEALITNVEAPSRIIEGEAFRIRVTVQSTANMPATLRVLAGGTVVYEELETLRIGVNTFEVLLRGAEQEFARYTVQLEPLNDTYYQNNQLAAFTEIMGAPRILLVSVTDGVDSDGDMVVDESPQLQLALEAAGLDVERTTPERLPASLAELSNYASVVLVNVNAKNLTPRKMEALQTYVRDLGGGLVVVGGPESYGMGGYFRTPLEETLPVDMQIKDQERFPSVSIAIVIDRSGSMGANEGGVTKIQLAAEGAVRVVELLNDFDEIAVFPVDTSPDNPIGPVPAADKEAVIAQIRQIGAGGGGIYVYTGLKAAADALLESTNQVKHIIVLADGSDSEEKEGVPELIDSLTSNGTTISFVSIGNGPDVPWLQEMATRGNGRFHFTDRAANIPQIFTQETTSIQRSYLIEERFFPSLAATRNNPFTRNIEQVPALYGYVGTSPKSTAQVVLETHQGDPLLANWQYGLGRAVAWTSDATGRWGVDWVRWEGFPTFWAQTVRWTISQGRENNIESVIDFNSEMASLTVDVRDSGGQFLNNLTMTANVVSPVGETESILLSQIAPGRYAGSFTPTTDGAYFVRIAGSDTQEETLLGQTTGWVLGYSPEYTLVDTNQALLTELAELTNGRNLTDITTSQEVFVHNLESEPTVRPIWTWLLLIAVTLLPFDIAVRRLVITHSDMRQLWAKTFGRLIHQPLLDAPRSEPMSRLFQAKERAGTQAPPSIAPVEAEDTLPPKNISLPQPQPIQTKPSPLPPNRESKPNNDSSSLASRLLEKKRQQQQKKQD